MYFPHHFVGQIARDYAWASKNKTSAREMCYVCFVDLRDRIHHGECLPLAPPIEFYSAASCATMCPSAPLP